MAKSYSIIGSVTVKGTPRARLSYRKPKNGKKKHRYETLSYADKNENGRWVNIRRVFDRENDHYYEIITDEETGKVIHEKDEPLSTHIGHGSEKFEKRKHSEAI